MPVLSYADRAKQRPTKQHPPPLQTATTSSSSSQPTTSTPSSASFQTATTSASVSAPPPFPAPAVSPVGPIVTPVSAPQPAKAPVVNVWQVRAARRAAPPPPPPVSVPAPVAVEDDPFVVRPRPPVATVDPWPTVSRGVYSATFAFGSADMWMPLHAWTILFGLHSCSIGDEALLCVASASPIDREVLRSAVTPVATSPVSSSYCYLDLSLLARGLDPFVRTIHFISSPSSPAWSWWRGLVAHHLLPVCALAVLLLIGPR
ncbi:hypothetical protein C8R45DRAFT_269219 [Mycena sanguinolenta]|nr:hypothetical protein C8R45DRAFT_269219 [Mycena sanguinolenta]